MIAPNYTPEKLFFTDADIEENIYNPIKFRYYNHANTTVL